MTLPIWPNLTPEEKRTMVRPLWDAELTTRQIAAHFTGATRNSIISVVHRGKMPMRPIDEQTKTALREKTKRVVVSRKPIPAQPGTPPIVQRMPEPDEPPASVLAMITSNRPPLPGSSPVTMADLPTRTGVMCRFPVVGGYCGLSCGDEMYCKEHKTIMYRPVEKFRMPKEARR